MTRQAMISAYTRAKKFSDVYLENYQKVMKRVLPDAYADKSMKEIKVEDMKEYKVFKMYLMTEKTSDGEPNMYYVGQEEDKPNRKLRHRKEEHYQNINEDWTSKFKIQLIGHFIGHNRKDAERIEEMLIQNYKHHPDYKGWKMMNDVYNKKKSDNVLYESTKLAKLTMDDYFERIFNVVIEKAGEIGEDGKKQKYNRVRCYLDSKIWEEVNSGKKFDDFVETYTPDGQNTEKKWNKMAYIHIYQKY